MIGHGSHGYGHHEIIPYHYNYAVADSYTGARFDQVKILSGPLCFVSISYLLQNRRSRAMELELEKDITPSISQMAGCL